MKSFRWLRQ